MTSLWTHLVSLEMSYFSVTSILVWWFGAPDFSLGALWCWYCDLKILSLHLQRASWCSPPNRLKFLLLLLFGIWVLGYFQITCAWSFSGLEALKWDPEEVLGRRVDFEFWSGGFKLSTLALKLESIGSVAPKKSGENLFSMNLDYDVILLL